LISLAAGEHSSQRLRVCIFYSFVQDHLAQELRAGWSLTVKSRVNLESGWFLQICYERRQLMKILGWLCNNWNPRSTDLYVANLSRQFKAHLLLLELPVFLTGTSRANIIQRGTCWGLILEKHNSHNNQSEVAQAHAVQKWDI
jgi:hypothetical protein